MTVKPITPTAAGTATGTGEAALVETALVDQAALTVILPTSGKLPQELPAEPRGWFAPWIDTSGDLPTPTVIPGAQVPASGTPVPFPELNQRFPDQLSTADLRRILNALRRRQAHTDNSPAP